MTKIMKRIMIAALSLAMVACFMPQMNTPVYATDGDPAMVAGAESVLKGTANTDNAQTVWYAGKTWFVISFDGTGNEYTKPNGAMTLLSTGVLGHAGFNEASNPGNDYEGSNLQTTVNGLYESLFSDKEKKAVMNRNLEIDEYKSSWPYSTGVSGTETSGYLWPLSTAEANMLPSNISKAVDEYGNGLCWWLRSPGNSDNNIAFVGDTGGVDSWGQHFLHSNNVRPAFDLNLSSVLFTSASEGGKSSGDEGTLNEVGTNKTSEWKLTLLDDGTVSGLDDHKDFEIDPAGITADPAAGTVTVPYSGAVAGNHEYISAIIKGSDGSIKYYGRIAKAFASDDASVSIDIAGKLQGGDTLWVFNEQYNGDKTTDPPAFTDYSSALKEVAVPKTKLIITANDQSYVYNGQKQGPADTAYDDPAEIAELVKVSGLWKGDSLTSIIVDGQGQDIGEYPLTPSGAAVNGKSASDKYDVVYVSGKLKITKKAVTFYTVTFADGLGKILKKQKVESGKSATAPAAPKRSGYTFAGWDKDFTKVTGDMTVTAKWKKNAKPAPKPSPAKISGTLLAKMTAKGSKKLEVTWNQIKGASGYDIFFVRCNHNGKTETLKKVDTVKGNKTFKWTKKGLKKKKAYKALVKAYVMKNGKKTYVKTSPTVHAYTSGYTKNFTNPKKVTVKQSSVSLKKGKTYQIKAKVKKLKKNRKLMPSGHEPKLRYLSSNGRIATVSSSGQIRAKAKGTCNIYVYAVNGVSKAIKVTVK